MIELNRGTEPVTLDTGKPVLSDAAQGQLRLRKATREFEALFIAQILKNMRNVSFSKQDDGFGKDVMMEMADEAVSRQLSLTGMLGIGDLLYERLVGRIQGDAAGDSQSPAAVARVGKGKQQWPSKETVSKYHNEIAYAARETGLSPKLIEAVMMQESSGDSTAVSVKGAQGLMQLMPDTAEALGVADAFDPGENILGGARYLKSLLNRFGDLRSALAAYNAGPGTVERYGGVPPYEETQNYVDGIVANLKEAK